MANQAPLYRGFSRQEYWSGFPCPPPGYIPNPGIEPTSLASLALAGRFFTTSTTWETPCPDTGEVLSASPAHLAVSQCAIYWVLTLYLFYPHLTGTAWAAGGFNSEVLLLHLPWGLPSPRHLGSLLEISSVGNSKNTHSWCWSNGMYSQRTWLSRAALPVPVFISQPLWTSVNSSFKTEAIIPSGVMSVRVYGYMCIRTPSTQ